MHTKALTVICDWNDLIKTQASKGAPNESSKYQKDQYLRCWGSSLNGPLHNNPRSYQPYQYLLIKAFFKRI